MAMEIHGNPWNLAETRARIRGEDGLLSTTTVPYCQHNWNWQMGFPVVGPKLEKQLLTSGIKIPKVSQEN